MANSKIQLADGTILLDISQDTVAAGNMLSGTTAHDSSGAAVTGTIPTQAATQVMPSRSAQQAVPAGTYMSGAVTVLPIPPTYALLTELFPVGGLWATKSSTADPAVRFGFGTWRKVAPAPATWNDLKRTTWNSIHSVPANVYVWERIA